MGRSKTVKGKPNGYRRLRQAGALPYALQDSVKIASELALLVIFTEHFSMHTGQIIVLTKIWKGGLQAGERRAIGAEARVAHQPRFTIEVPETKESHRFLPIRYRQAEMQANLQL